MAYTYDQILSDLKNKIYKPIYLLYGEESYFIDQITDRIANEVLNDSEKTFNQTVIYGKDIDTKFLVQTAKRYPMMSNYQVVIVKEAQNLKLDEHIDSYFETPLKSTIFVMAMKDTAKLDKRTKVIKNADKNGVVFESKKLYEKDMMKWIDTLAKSYNLTLMPDAQRLMYEHIGDNLSRLDGEMKKLQNSISDNKPITTDIVAQNIGINRDFNIFELQKAIGQKNSLKAYQIVNYFAQNNKSTPMVLCTKQLFEYFSKILSVHYATDRSQNGLAAMLGVNPFFVREYTEAASNYPVGKIISIISFIREADAQSKGMCGTGYTDADIYKELIYKILHV